MYQLESTKKFHFKPENRTYYLTSEPNTLSAVEKILLALGSRKENDVVQIRNKHCEKVLKNIITNLGFYESLEPSKIEQISICYSDNQHVFSGCCDQMLALAMSSLIMGYFSDSNKIEKWEIYPNNEGEFEVLLKLASRFGF